MAEALEFALFEWGQDPETIMDTWTLEKLELLLSYSSFRRQRMANPDKTRKDLRAENFTFADLQRAGQQRYEAWKRGL